MPLAPFINRFVDTINQKDFKNLIIILVIILCVLPTLSVKGATNGIVLQQGGKNLVYFLFLYILGRYLRLHNDINYNRWGLLGGHIICTLLLVGLNVLVRNVLNMRFVAFRFDCSPLILISSLCVFYLFKSWNYHSRIINWLASSVFGFYLLSNIYYVINERYIHLETFSQDTRFVLFLIVLVLAAFVFSLVVDKTFGSLMKWIFVKIEDFCEPKIKNSKLYKRIKQ